MRYNDQNYYYLKNTLGDIIGIRDETGAQVATYTYDALGNIVSKSGSMADVNPFRYRGYYYDNETGFYYLQTRYYDPSIRMFINADNYELTSTLAQTVGQLNMYAYANNNPIMYTDESGESVTVAYVIGCVIVGALFNGVAQVSYNLVSGNEWYSGMAGAVFAGAFNGFGLALGWHFALVGGAAAVLNAGINQFEYYISGNENFNLGVFMNETMIYALTYIGANRIGDLSFHINKGWFLPQSLPSFFTKSIGRKVMMSTGIYGTIGSIIGNVYTSATNELFRNIANRFVDISLKDCYLVG